MKRTAILVALAAFSTALAVRAQSNGAADDSQSCAYDRAALLALEEQSFDQDLEGGWRAVARQQGCLEAAANLIRDYREANGLSSYILFWHEAQLRAYSDDTQPAIALFEQSYKAPDDGLGWNIYVDATVAFMRGDREALLAARKRLVALPEPPNRFTVDVNGNEIEPPPWPPNLRVVDNLIRCYERTYAEAYSRCAE